MLYKSMINRMEKEQISIHLKEQMVVSCSLKVGHKDLNHKKLLKVLKLAKRNKDKILIILKNIILNKLKLKKVKIS